MAHLLTIMLYVCTLFSFTKGLNQGCGKTKLFLDKVVNGQTARPNSWPWQVSLIRTVNGRIFHFCGGSLINDQWVVTAAHCVQGRSASSFRVRLGEHDFKSNESSEIDSRVLQVIVHPRYSRVTINNDIALIKLSQRISLKPQIQPICLPQQGVSVDKVSGQNCYITGWGRTGAGKPGATVLQQARLPVISESECRRYMGPIARITRQMICAGFGGNSTVSGCNGDSGGPFVCRDKSSNRWILQGAVSWGTRTCSAGKNEFTVFARVSEFVNWIKQNVGNVQPPPTSANCNFDNGKICSYQNGPGQFRWTLRKGSTPSVTTGPSSDVSGGGYYLYIETSSPRQPGDKATILTPNLTGPHCMKFSYHMYGSDIGMLNVYANNKRVFTKSGNQGNRWMKVEISILEKGKVKFEGIRGSGWKGDIAIDAIVFTPGSCSGTISSANCNFDKGKICSYKNGPGQFKWTVRKGSTPSVGTGPSSDASGGGYYLYIETSHPRQPGDTATILTPELTGPHCMKFSYHMYGSNIGALNVYANNKMVFRKSGNQGNRWMNAEISILEKGKVKFEGVRGNSWQGDIAIDAIVFTPGSCSGTISSVNCNFDSGSWCSFKNDANDDFDWTIKSGRTPSSGTGPSRDHSTNGKGKYVYIETSSPRKQGDKANLVSPQVSGAQCLKFFYHMYGASMGSLIVTQTTGSKELFRKSGNQDNQWKKAEVQIDGGSGYSIVFSGVRGTSFQGDIALDEISITPGQCSGSSVTTPRPPLGSCGQKGYGLSDFPKIVGGQQATPGEWPWQVALFRRSSSRPFCGGSLVSNQYVITAAHCVKATDWNHVTIRLGEHNTNVNEGHEQTISIAPNGITVHPQYNRLTTDYDIAVIKLSKSVQFTQRIKPVCINKGVDFTGQRCYITGWGTLSSGGSTPNVLQEAQVPIVTTQECRNSYGSSRITDRMLCAGYYQGGIDACQGDSGGPLVCKHKDGSWYLTGITSWGRGCASVKYYGVYAHVANLYPWVKQVTGLSF